MKLQKKFKKCEDFLILQVYYFYHKNINKGYLLPDSQLTVDCDMSKL